MKLARKKQLSRSRRKQKIIALLLQLRILFAMMGNKKAIRSLAILENQLGLRSEVVKRRGKKGKHRKKGSKKKRTTKRRASKKQAANRRRFKAFIKRHGRPPRKGEKLSA